MSRTSLAPSPDEARPDPAGARTPYRFVAAMALLGAALLMVGTLLHPAHADPGSPAAAFAEYAGVSRGLWVAAHLLQLGGVAGLVLVVVRLARAVDGVALKAMVDLWSGAGEDRSGLFAAALAVRQV